METEVFGSDTFYAFRLLDGVLTVTFRGETPKGVFTAWHDMKEAFSFQLSQILKEHEVRSVRFRADRFGCGLARLCRYELQGQMNGKSERVVEENSAMKMIYMENAIFCTSRYSEECSNGLTIEIDAPLDTVFHFRREDGGTYDAAFHGGTVCVPGEFLTDGKYLVCASFPRGLPTNVLHMEVKTGERGKYISCSKDYDDLLDAVYKLMTAYHKTEQRVSAHIDGYEVI